MPRALPPIWLAAPSRFAGLRRGRAIAVLIALLLVVAGSFAALYVPDAPEAAPSVEATGDLALYEGVIAGLRVGGEYYQLTADGLRMGGYPLRPFITFRPPMHSVVQAALPLAVTLGVLWLLVIAVAAAWWVRLSQALPRRLPRIAAMILLAGGLVAFTQVNLIAFHEIWAALLIALSLAIRRPGRWVEAAALGLIAMLVRETAMLFVVIMGALAWLEGHKREGAGWAAALAVFLIALVAHAWGVARVTGPLDPASPGWSGLNGFGFFVSAFARSTALAAIPLAVAAPLAALALFGWTVWRDALALRAALVFAGYAVAIGLFARLDTFYWALMVAPAFLVGLAFVPDGLRDLARAILDRRRVRVQRITQ